MNDLTPLNRPIQSQVKIEPVAKECLSDGFEYPTFRQLNKHARIYLSKPLALSPSTPYNLFDVANSKGWFVAVKHASSGSDIIFSTLEDLRSSFSSAKGLPDELFTPKRTITIGYRANIVRFAAQDSRLLVAQDNGSLLLFDTSQLFTQGSNEVHPLTSTHIQTTYLRQIVPNPGTEPGLSELIAVVSDGRVQLFDIQLDQQGGWTATDLMTQPIAVSWSPKGKHIAIGLQAGDILTYSLTNKITPHKHIPPTVDGILTSLNWLAPGHTFRTSYSQGTSSPQQHVVVLDTKTSTATYFAPEHPFPVGDRNFQSAYVLNFSKWDAATLSNDENKHLTVVGDASSTDIEVLGNIGNAWFRQMQDNPLQLPLNSTSDDDTTLLALESDLTDSAAAAPIMYAYLNDGSLQGWHLEHSKPYLGIITPNASGLSSSAGQLTSQVQDSGKDTDMGAEEVSTSNAFTQQRTTSTFGQSSFAQQSTSGFESQQMSAFAQTGFGQKSPQENAAFGQTAFGQPPTFGATSGFGSTSAFGPGTPSDFGDIKPTTGFGAFGGTNSTFGSSGTSPFGSTTSSVFGNIKSGVSNVFGQGSFGGSIPSSNEATTDTTTITREASMSDSTPSLGGFGLGSATPSDPNARNTMFGSFSTTPSTSATNDQSSGFGNGPLVKPATGFGAFGNYKPSSTFEAPKPVVATTSALVAPSQTTATSGFGQSGFASPAFGKSAFGQPAFGQPAFGKPSLGASSTTTATTSGGFSAFANTPTTFATAASTGTTGPSSGGFSAYASTPTAFGTAAETKPASGGGFSAFASTSPSPFGAASPPAKPSATGGGFGSFASATPSAFGTTTSASETTTKESPKETAATSTSPFATPSQPAPGAAAATQRTSVFGTTASPFAQTTSASPSIFATPSRPSPFANIDDASPEHPSPSSSPEPFRSPVIKPAASSFTPSSTPNAFSNLQTTPSAFKPAGGFGAFGSFGTPNTDSPFYKKSTETPPVSAFALGASPRTPTNVAAAPTFGSTSALGAVRSAFAPITPPTAAPTTGLATNAFSAFSAAPSSFSSYVPNKTSFSDLLKTGGEETLDTLKVPALPLASKTEEKSSSERVSTFGTPSTPLKKSTVPKSAFAPIPKDNGAESEKRKPVSDEPSYGSLSISSSSSSFVDVTREEKEEGEYNSDEDAEHSDNESANSFLSENYSEGEEFEGGEEELPELPDIDEEEEVDESAETPVAPSRSPSPTPQPETPETPSIKVSLSPEENEAIAEAQAPEPREKSATPPASPVKEINPSLTPTPSTPVPNAAHSPFGIGLGRPSTRPTRSSPLANAISRSDDEEEERKPAAPIPVSPKAPVEVLPVKLEEEEDTSLKRPKTPPLLSVLGGKKSPTPSTSALPSAAPALTPADKPDGLAYGGLGALTTAAAASSPSVFGAAPDKTPPAQSAFGRPATVASSMPATTPSGTLSSGQAPLFGMPAFSLKNITAVSGVPSGGIPGIKSPTLPPMPNFGASLNQQPAGVFGVSKQAPQTPMPAASNGLPSTPKPPFPLNAGSPLTPKPQGAPSPGSPEQRQESAFEEGMQKECMRLVYSMQSDFKQIFIMSQGAQKAVADISNHPSGSRIRADLGDKTKWTLNDLGQFKQLLKQYEVELDLLEANKDKDQQTLREIHSNMLKAGTRREEIARFNKAKDDKDFAKMLKSRTLGPEYSETQAQLRKSIKNIRDRIQKLETHLVEDKKKVAQSKSYKPSFRAPSLDTINRSYRNIEKAIDIQSKEVANLASRIRKLDIKEGEASHNRGRDKRLPDAADRRSQISPNVAAVTAAALNAERTAARLKNALLSVRSQPLLNTKVASAPSAPVAFTTPHKAPASGPSLFGESASADAFLDWDIPPDNFDPSGSPSPSSHRGAGKAKKRQAFKRNPAQTPTAAAPAPPGFEWGPLPTFSAPPPQPTFSFASFVKKQTS